MMSKKGTTSKTTTTASSDAQASTQPASGTAAIIDEDVAKVATHLEYHGYDVGPREEDGWVYATHSSRYDVAVRTFVNGTRLFSKVGIGASRGNTRTAWLEYLNTANARALITQFSLAEGREGTLDVRMTAFVSGRYTQSDFATMLDYWHADLDLVRRKPEFPAVEDDAAEQEASASMTVH